MKKQKMKAKILLLMGIIILTTKVFSQDPNFHIYLCFGQSNMEGQGTIGTQDKIVDDRFKVMESLDCSNLGRTKGEWYTAVPPLTRCYTKLSPADYFGRTMVANLPDSISVGVINVSVAGCKIELFDKVGYQDYVASVTEDWLKNIIAEYDGNPYAHLVELAKLAQEDGVIKGILLHQGESNTGDSQWPSKVQAVYDSIIYDLGLNADSVPLLAGEVVHADQGGLCASMNSIIGTLPQTIPNSYIIPSSGCTDQSDNLHFNSTGYRKLGRRYAVQMLSLLGYEAIYFEPECSTPGENWRIIQDSEASNKAYITATPGMENTSETTIDAASSVQMTFTVDADSTYYLFGRFNCPSTDEDSYWIKIDDGNFELYDNLTTTDWQWLQIDSYELAAGGHTLSISYSEDGAKLDKLCIKNSSIIPQDVGEEALTICTPEISPSGIASAKTFDGFELGKNYPNPFSESTTISFKIPKKTYVSLKVYNMLGMEIEELGGKEFIAGEHTLEYAPGNMAVGQYFYTIKADKFSASQRMVFLAD